MIPVPPELRQRFSMHGQDHVFRFWDRLDTLERRSLLEQLEQLDLPLLRRLFEAGQTPLLVPTLDQIEPVPVIRPSRADAEARRVGEEALSQGEVAVLLVAGGQGSRLGFEHPKGMYPVGPVTGKSLFQIHCEKILARRRRHGRPIPILIMTSPATDEETKAYFAAQQNFGLPPEDVHFFCQGTMPALDMTTGQLLLESPGRLFLSPNGHGGTLTALVESGLLRRLETTGIRHLFYFQVDNPLVKVADPTFLGHHIQAKAEVSSKIVPKETPGDKLGNLVLHNGRCSMIEYSDLPRSLAEQRDATGQLRLAAGSPAIHVFDVEFLKRVVGSGMKIPFHTARKKVPYVNEEGVEVIPTTENALKFELFVFDVLPLAERWTIVETSRHEEFMPLKNATGPDSPETVRQAQSLLFGDWLEAANVTVPRDQTGVVTVPIEISPLLALDAAELAARLRPEIRVLGPTYLD